MEDYKVMRHAILVAGMKDSGVLQQVINLYEVDCKINPNAVRTKKISFL